MRYGPFALGEGLIGSDRTLLLECRLEQLRGALDEARAEADQARVRLAAAAAREAGETRRLSLLQDEVARAREEVASLHRRLEHSEALRAKQQGHLFESEPADAQELVRLRQEVAAARERIAGSEQTAAQLRVRVDELAASRETLLAKLIEWQRAVRQGDTEAVDLAEFIASLRRAVIDLERENAQGERREAALRAQLEAMPAATPERAPVDDLGAALAAVDAEIPSVRAAAYQTLGRLLERDPARLAPHIRRGIADPNPHVRRRAALAAAAARGLDLRPLLEPLTGDPDTQVRRVVQRILRGTHQDPQRTEARIVQRAS